MVWRMPWPTRDELPVLLGTVEEPAVIKSFDAQVTTVLLAPAPAGAGHGGRHQPGRNHHAGRAGHFPVLLPLLATKPSAARRHSRSSGRRQDDGLDAVVVHVDSPGGSALASDPIWRELALLNRAKPVII